MRAATSDVKLEKFSHFFPSLFLFYFLYILIWLHLGFSVYAREKKMDEKAVFGKKEKAGVTFDGSERRLQTCGGLTAQLFDSTSPAYDFFE